jgi:hypothetical protein
VISDFLRELLRFVILVLIRPVLKVVGAIFSPIYRFLFEGFDNQTHKKLHERLCQGIRQNLPWLFDRYGAKVIPNTRPYPRAFDYAVVTVSAERMLFAFIQGRGELRVEIAPEYTPNGWQEIGEVISTIDGLKGPPRYYNLAGFGRVLERNVDHCRNAFSKKG